MYLHAVILIAERFLRFKEITQFIILLE